MALKYIALQSIIGSKESKAQGFGDFQWFSKHLLSAKEACETIHVGSEVNCFVSVGHVGMCLPPR